jgi:hypothetical protein
VAQDFCKPLPLGLEVSSWAAELRIWHCSLGDMFMENLGRSASRMDLGTFLGRRMSYPLESCAVVSGNKTTFPVFTETVM